MSRRFEWRFWPTVGTIVGFALLVGLGTWQTSRYFQKTERERLRAERIEKPPLELRSLEALESPSPNYRRVRIEGEVDTSTTIVFRHRFHEGNPGVWVAHPLRLAEGDGVVLVNRGWVPMQRAREGLDELPALGSGPFQGLIYELPQVIAEEEMRRKLESGEVELLGTTTRWDTFDVGGIYARLEASTPTRPLAFVLDDAHSGDPYPIASTSHTTESYLTPTRHLSYAIFWFSVAIALVAMYVAAGLGVLKSERRGQFRPEDAAGEPDGT
jgi:surfeit locus 1 family protein